MTRFLLVAIGLLLAPIGCTDLPVVATPAASVRPHLGLAATDWVADSAANHGRDSHAMHTWSPGRGDTCAPEVHARYSVIGPDGKRYPTWHPPTDPETGCRFGHEHGRDPRGSALFAQIGSPPFGYGAERLMTWDPAGMRHEDHVGHKIEWENDVQLHYSIDGQRVPFEVRCHWLTKFHQGTHSPDAFVNNTHELNYHVRCTDGTAIDAVVMSRLGPVGRFERACAKGTMVNGVLTPMPGQTDGRGTRLIPDRTCVLQQILVRSGQWSGYSGALYENWSTANYLRTSDGREIAYFDPGFAVFNPSRYHDPSAPGVLRRTLDLCYEVAGRGRTERRARGGECDWGTNSGALRLAWDDPRSPFRGDHREVYFNQTTLSNANGPTVWYTDPYGGHASPQPFVGSIRQVLAPISNRRPFPLESQAVGATRRYGTAAVHAPN